MPCLKIMTNQPKNKVAKDFVDKIIPTLAKSMGKPEDKFICMVSTDVQLSIFRDSLTPGAVATLESIGGIGSDENKVITKALSDFVQKEMGVAPGRFFLSFYDLEPPNIGINGTTVEELFK